MSQIQAFKCIVSSIPSMSAKHSAAVLVLTIHLILVDDQKKMQFCYYSVKIYVRQHLILHRIN